MAERGVGLGAAAAQLAYKSAVAVAGNAANLTYDAAQRYQNAQAMLCVDGKTHDWTHALAENEKAEIGGKLSAGACGVKAGVSAHKMNDGGQRILAYCKKCGNFKEFQGKE